MRTLFRARKHREKGLLPNILRENTAEKKKKQEKTKKILRILHRKSKEREDI